MRMHAKALIALLAALSSGGFLTPPANAGTTTSRIAFVGPYSSGMQVFLINPDGSGLQSTGLAAYSLDLRGDLTRLVLQGNDGNLYVTNPDGAGIVPLGLLGARPKWSPDGTRLLFIAGSSTGRSRQSSSRGQLAIVNADGTNPRSLGVEATDADWSPTGDQIVFAAPGTSSGFGALNLIAPDGTGLTPLGINGMCPRWSGSRIAFLGAASTSAPQVYIASLSRARAVTSVTSLGVTGWNLAWSPDGAKLAVAPSGSSVVLVNADGTGAPQSLGVEAEWLSWKASSPEADLRLSKLADHQLVRVGDSVTFTVTLTNDGPATATNVVVADVLPASLSSPQVTLTGASSTYAASTGRWSIPSLAAGESATLTVVGTTSAPETMTNVAEVIAADQSDPDSTPNNHVATEDDQGKAVVKVVEADAPDLGPCQFFNNRIVAQFSEEVDQSQAEDPTNYLIQVADPGEQTLPPPTGLPSGATLRYTPGQEAQAGQPAIPPRLVISHVAFRTKSMVRLAATGIEDLAGNPIDDGVNACKGRVVLPPGTTLQKVSGDGQKGIVGKLLGDKLVVGLRDALSQPVPLATVWFTPQQDNGEAVQILPRRQVPPAGELAVETDGNGRAEVRWRLGPVAGQQKLDVRAEIGAHNSPVQFTAEAAPDRAARVLLSVLPMRAPVGDSALVRVTVLDDQGNGVPNVPLRLEVTAGGGTIDVGDATPTTNARGEFAARLDGVTLGANTVRVAVANLDSAAAAVTGVWQLKVGRGVQLFTVPFRLADANPAHVLGVPAAQLRLATYKTATQEFVFFPQTSFPLEFGRGYFGLFPTAKVVDITDGTPGVDLDAMPFDVVYPAKGWRLIGNPFLTSLYWRLREVHALVRDKDLGPLAQWLTGPAAINRPVEPYLFVIDPDARPGDPYRIVFDPAALGVLPAALRSRVVDRVLPGQGAWALIKVADAGFRFPASVTQPASPRSAAEVRGRAQAPAGWSLELIATDGQLQDGGNVIGVGPGAGFQLPEPPQLPQSDGSYLSLSLVPTGNTRVQAVPGPLSVDVRPDGAATQLAWEAVVRTNKAAQPVTLRWPDLSRTPTRVRLYLTDLTTGRRQAMRTTTSYTFTTGRQAGTERRFRITAETAGQARLTIDNLRIMATNRGGGWNLSYTLSEPATVRILVRSAAGRTVRQLGPQAGRAGVNVCQWTARSVAGQPLPRGVYLVEVAARSDSGEEVRRIGVVSLR